MIHILVAMEREAKALGIPCEVIGIGAENLPDTSGDDVLVNVGYCGGYQVAVGKVIEPGCVISASTGETEDIKTHFPCENHPCVTADTFVTRPILDGAAVYDMELWKVAHLPHKELYALKIVSDNLDEKDCEAFHDQEAWEQVRTLLKGEKLI